MTRKQETSTEEISGNEGNGSESGFKAFLRDFLERVVQGTQLLVQLRQEQERRAFEMAPPLCPFDGPRSFQPFVVNGELMLLEEGRENMRVVTHLNAELLPPTEEGWTRFLDLAARGDNPSFQLAEVAQSWFGRPLGSYVDYHRFQLRKEAR